MTPRQLFDPKTPPALRTELPDCWIDLVRDAVDAHIDMFAEELPGKVEMALTGNTNLSAESLCAIRGIAAERLAERIPSS